jgi:hypothetical protein
MYLGYFHFFREITFSVFVMLGKIGSGAVLQLGKIFHLFILCCFWYFRIIDSTKFIAEDWKPLKPKLVSLIDVRKEWIFMSLLFAYYLWINTQFFPIFFKRFANLNCKIILNKRNGKLTRCHCFKFIWLFKQKRQIESLNTNSPCTVSNKKCTWFRLIYTKIVACSYYYDARLLST